VTGTIHLIYLYHHTWIILIYYSSVVGCEHQEETKLRENKKILALLILTLLTTTTTNTIANKQNTGTTKIWTEKRLEETIDRLKRENTVLAKELARIPTDWDYTEFKADYSIQPHIEKTVFCPLCKKYFPEEKCEKWLPNQTKTKYEELLKEKTKLEKEQQILREALIYHAERHYRNRTYKKRFSKCERVVLHFKTPGSDIECCPHTARYMITIVATRPAAEQPRSWLCPNISTPPPKELCEAHISIKGEQIRRRK